MGLSRVVVHMKEVSDALSVRFALMRLKYRWLGNRRRMFRCEVFAEEEKDRGMQMCEPEKAGAIMIACCNFSYPRSMAAVIDSKLAEQKG